MKLLFVVVFAALSSSSVVATTFGTGTIEVLKRCGQLAFRSEQQNSFVFYRFEGPPPLVGQIISLHWGKTEIEGETFTGYALYKKISQRFLKKEGRDPLEFDYVAAKAGIFIKGKFKLGHLKQLEVFERSGIPVLKPTARIAGPTLLSYEEVSPQECLREQSEN